MTFKEYVNKSIIIILTMLYVCLLIIALTTYRIKQVRKENIRFKPVAVYQYNGGNFVGH